MPPSDGAQAEIQAQLSKVDEMLKGKNLTEMVNMLRQKLVEAETSLAETRRHQRGLEEQHQAQLELFVSEIGKMQQFAVDGMSKVR